MQMLLTTGRVAGQWHTRTKTANVVALNRLDPAPYLQMHPDDAAALGLHDGERGDREPPGPSLEHAAC
jgi:anaerobic selenocysteine-containing dehydrogenase